MLFCKLENQKKQNNVILLFGDPNRAEELIIIVLFCNLGSDGDGGDGGGDDGDGDDGRSITSML